MNPVRYSRCSPYWAMPMRCISLSILCLLALPLAAQEPSHPCARLADPAARLVCYDSAFPLSPEVAEAATQQAQADFGLDRPQAASDSGYRVQHAEPDGFESRVVKVDHGRGGVRSFNLENGQVWTQVEARSSGHVQDGQVVQVRKGVLGSYQLVTPAGVNLRVRRAR